MVEGRSFPLLSSAYDELAEGLRVLAAQIEAAADAGAGRAAPATAHPSVRDAVRDAVRGLGEVFLQALLLGSALLLGFNVWMALAPPLRPVT